MNHDLPLPAPGFVVTSRPSCQAAFAAAILDPARPLPDGLAGPDGTPCAKRFAVYRNNVAAGLGEALAAAFPAVRRLVGEAFFALMARTHALREPPRSPLMFDYGAGFAAFIATFAPAATLPYLPDVARLERAWVEAYHAAEATPADARRLGAIAPAQWAQWVRAGLALHPSVRVVRSAFPAVTIWQMNVEGGEPAAVDLGRGGEDALVVRPDAEVDVRVLPPGAAAFIEALAAGLPVASATRTALRDHPAFDLAATLRGLLDAGAVTGWHAPGENGNQPARQA
ncbi:MULTISPECIES: HvfC/BufC family peptide modification chaperone [Cupriavidus]